CGPRRHGRCRRRSSAAPVPSSSVRRCSSPTGRSSSVRPSPRPPSPPPSPSGSGRGSRPGRCSSRPRSSPPSPRPSRRSWSGR
ncbi:MAG: hypothetical protein AVDCRST_MAG59-2043, partial [uncultured Thermomicrobiales bacterium]